jgi:hypothetical protein
VLGVLVERPDRILPFAAVFAILGLFVFVGWLFGARPWLRVWPSLAMSCVWALYAQYEASMQGGGYNIRVDLLLIHPLLILLSVLAFIFTAIPRRRAGAGSAGDNAQVRDHRV